MSKKTVTLLLDPELVREARHIAIDRNTTLSALVEISLRRTITSIKEEQKQQQEKKSKR